jgi:glycosyltransferase involved in cell wall biosynthesis
LADDERVAFADPDDPASIASALRWFLDDRERYALASRSAREAFEQRYNFQRVVPEVIVRLRALVPGVAIP